MPQILARTLLALPTDTLPATHHINEPIRTDEHRRLATAEQSEIDFFTDDYAAAATDPLPCFADCDVFLPRAGNDEVLRVRIPFAIPLTPQHANHFTTHSSSEDEEEEKGKEMEDEDEGAAMATVPSTDISDAAHPPNVSCAAFAEKGMQREAETDCKAKRYAMRLPRDFALTYRLPHALENALRRAAADPNVPAAPIWLSAFVRHGGRAVLAASDVLALEAITAAALELVAHMGSLRQHISTAHSGNNHSYCNLNAKAHINSSRSHAGQKVTMAQWGLLWSEESLFAFGQAERVAQRLRCDAFLFAAESPSWPSLTAVIFHVAQEITRSLFPALSTGVEAAILTALQPLLEANPSNPAHSQGSLCTDSQRRDAVLLLTQGLAQWWWWWRPDSEGNHNIHSSSSNNSYAGSQDSMPYTYALSAAMSYGAVRALQDFAIVPASSLDLSAEDGETALFLIAAPSLLSALLLDRDITGVLDRAVKAMQAMPLTAPSSSFSLQLSRCITVLLCWMAFRPAGYESSLARAHFGTLLRLAAPPLAAHNGRDNIGERLGVEDQMAQCGRHFCMRTGAMLRRLRAQCGKANGNGNADARRVNPWRQLRGGEGIHKSRDEDECTAHSSYRSLMDGNEGTERSHDGMRSALPLPLPFPLSSQGAPEALRALRHAVREVRVALRRLERDAFGEAGGKRCRGGESAPRLAGISPQLAYHIYARPDSAQWEWHMDEDREGEDETTTSSSRSGSSGE